VDVAAIHYGPILNIVYPSVGTALPRVTVRATPLPPGKEKTKGPMEVTAGRFTVVRAAQRVKARLPMDVIAAGNVTAPFALNLTHRQRFDYLSFKIFDHEGE
jgi:hypothetical protein